MNDNFLMKVGLYEYPLKWSYNEFGHLTTDVTRFQNLWHLVMRIWFRVFKRMLSC